MNALRSQIAGKSLSRWHIAADGQWEKARILPASPNDTEIGSLIDWVSTASSDIAIEPVFTNEVGEFFFFGVRVKKLGIEDKIRLLKNTLTANQKGSTFDEVAQNMRQALASPTLFKEPPDFLELGAEGFWKSYGFYKVWDRVGKPVVSTLDEIEAHASQLLHPFERSIMLEYAWKEPYPAWIALHVSAKRGDGYQFSPDRFAELTKFVR